MRYRIDEREFFRVVTVWVFPVRRVLQIAVQTKGAVELIALEHRTGFNARDTAGPHRQVDHPAIAQLELSVAAVGHQVRLAEAAADLKAKLSALEQGAEQAGL